MEYVQMIQESAGMIYPVSRDRTSQDGYGRFATCGLRKQIAMIQEQKA
jgi:hypothetical protein